MTDKLISQKAVLDHLNDICNRCGRFNRNNGAECGYCELCGMDEFVEELPTIPQTNLTYDMVEQYAKENGFVIWTKEQTEDTMRKLLNYMNTEKQINTAEWILCKDRLPELTKYGYTDVSAEGYTIEEWASEEVLISYCINGKTNECVAFLQKVIFSDTGGIEYDWITNPFGESDSIYAGISTDDVKESVKVIAWQPLPTPPIAE